MDRNIAMDAHTLFTVLVTWIVFNILRLILIFDNVKNKKGEKLLLTEIIIAIIGADLIFGLMSKILTLISYVTKKKEKK